MYRINSSKEYCPMSMAATLASKLTLAPDLSPVSRDRNFKGRIKQMFGTYSAQIGKSILASLFGALFFLPLIAVFVVVLNYVVEPNILADYNFVGNLGIGYGATDGSTFIEALSRIYDARIQYSLFIIPGMMIGSIGMAGVYNYMRNCLWGVESKFFRDFFRGIKRHWYKFLIVYTVLGVIATGATCSILEIIKANAIGAPVAAYWWVLAIVSCLLGLIAVMYCIILVPMFVTYKFSQKPFENFGICLKNAAILTCMNWIQVLIISVLFIAPCLLFLISQISLIVLIIFIAVGFSFYALMNISYSQFMTDNFIAYLYSKQQEEAKKQQQKEAKAAAKKAESKNNNKISYKKKKK